jgi:hypothetical protein
MTSKLLIPKISKDNNMSGIRGLIGRKMTKKVKFMGEDITISKLSVAEVMQVQEQAKQLETSDNGGFDILKTVIRAAVEGGSDLADEDFQNFPVDELSKLSNEVMKFSGIGQEQGK